MSTEHAVLIDFQYGLPDTNALFDLEKELEHLISPGVGEFDGDELAVDLSSGTLFFYGPDADRLWAAIEATVKRAAFMRGAKVKLRYGPPDPGVRQVIRILP